MDLPVLKYVDVLIGLSLVMLLVATVALSISQALLNMLRSRSRHLCKALERLLGKEAATWTASEWMEHRRDR